jgi:nitrite reductase (NADH) small subunit
MKHSTDWIRVTAAANIPLREGRAVKVGGLEIAIFNLGDRFAAIENRCPHLGGPLADGIVGGYGDSVTVTCPLHTRRLCLDSGQVVKPGGKDDCVRTFAVRVSEGIVQVEASSLGQAFTAA